MQKLKKPELYKVYVDSLKIRIDMNLISNLDKNFSKNLKVIDITSGEIIQDYEKNKITISHNGIKTHFAIEELISSNDGTRTRFLTIRVSAKILKEKYFDGISIYTLDLLYKEIMNLNLFYISEQDFYQSKFSDLDLCYNYEYFSIKKEIEKFKQFSKLVIPSREIDKGVKIFPKESKNYNKGITLQFNTKGKSGFKRIYTKDRELKTKSIEFTKNYLIDVYDFDNIMRYELNVWNSQQLKKITEENTLIRFLFYIAINQKTVLSYMVNELIKEVQKKETIVKRKNVTLNELIIIEFINALENTGSNINWEYVFELLIMRQESTGKGRKLKTDINKKRQLIKSLLQKKEYKTQYTNFELLIICPTIKDKKIDKRKIPLSIRQFI